MTSAAFEYVKLRYNEGAYTITNLTTLVTRGKITEDEKQAIVNSE